MNISISLPSLSLETVYLFMVEGYQYFKLKRVLLILIKFSRINDLFLILERSQSKYGCKKNSYDALPFSQKFI